MNDENKNTETNDSPFDETTEDESTEISCKNNKKIIIIIIAALLVVLIGTFGILYGTKIICFHSSWSEATCTIPQTCERCGETKGEPLGHEWIDADCENPKTCKVCGETEGEPLGHEWINADCEDPKTCKVCGETEGEPLGHKWKDATCEKPKACELCGATEGEPTEHKWVEATCKQAKHCSLCGKTEGEPLEHIWTEATCTLPETCSVCGQTFGSSLGHDYQKGICTRCGENDPNHLSLSDVSSIDEMEKYLNDNYSSIDTPYGAISVKIEIDYPTTNTEKSLDGYDMYIKCSADFMIKNAKKTITEYDWVLLPWDLDNINVTDGERQEMVNIMKSYQKNIASDVMTCFPSSFIMGGFYDFTSSGWTISDDYVNWHDSDTDRYFTWTNFIGRSGNHSYYDSFYRDDMILTGFGWASDGDDKWYGYND